MGCRRVQKVFAKLWLVTNCVSLGERAKRTGEVINYEPHLRKDKTKFLMCKLIFFSAHLTLAVCITVCYKYKRATLSISSTELHANFNFFIKVKEIKFFTFPSGVRGKRHSKYCSFPFPRTDDCVTKLFCWQTLMVSINTLVFIGQESKDRDWRNWRVLFSSWQHRHMGLDWVDGPHLMSQNMFPVYGFLSRRDWYMVKH